MRPLNLLQLSLIALFALPLAACGDKDKKEHVKSETQVVAKVGGDEISIHQVNYQLGKLGQLDEAQSKQAAKQILAKLVDLQVLKSKAIESKLDRDPNVVQALEAMKDQMLAQAYMEQQMSKLPKPAESEVKDFYEKNPLLFQNRHIYRLQELVINVDKTKIEEVRSAISGMKEMTEIANWLKSKSYLFNANTNVRAAEQLPMDLLKKLDTMKDGEIVTVTSAQAVNVVHLVASKTEPIDLTKAKPFIEQYLTNKSKNESAGQELKQLKNQVKIEYLGEFASLMKETETKAIGAPQQELKTSEPKTQQAPANTGMEKGLSGL